MTNVEKYKTALERVKAFHNYCSQHMVCEDCELKGIHKKHILGRPMCVCAWLDLEADEEKPLPCPFCGDSCYQTKRELGGFDVSCSNLGCNYCSGEYDTQSDAIAAHNRVAKAVVKARVS